MDLAPCEDVRVLCDRCMLVSTSTVMFMFHGYNGSEPIASPPWHLLLPAFKRSEWGAIWVPLSFSRGIVKRVSDFGARKAASVWKGNTPMFLDYTEMVDKNNRSMVFYALEFRKRGLGWL